MNLHSPARALVVGAAALVLLAGCASADSGAGAPPAPPAGAPAADGPVLGQGMVLQKDDAAPVFCLGAVAESYPPQCSGPEIVGWDWGAVELTESASGVTWGTFAVVGDWDGERFEVLEDPIPLALYDPMAAEPDPRLDPANAGVGEESELLGIQEELAEQDAFEVLVSSVENGYLFVTVIHDDGSIQDYLDAEYGADRIAVVSALQPVGS